MMEFSVELLLNCVDLELTYDGYVEYHYNKNKNLNRIDVTLGYIFLDIGGDNPHLDLKPLIDEDLFVKMVEELNKYFATHPAYEDGYLDLSKHD